jgi:L-malate glycosyltransferase
MATKAINKKVCIVTPEFPPDQWGGLARTAERVAEHVADCGLDVHVAHCMTADAHVVLLDENRESQTRNQITVHRVSLSKDRSISEPRDLWECPHNLTLQMMYQSLELLHHREEFDLFHSFFLYPVGYVTGLLARRFGRKHLATVVGNDVNKYFFSPEKVSMCRSGLENADMVVGLGKDLIALANSLSPIESKSRVIYNSVELPAKTWSRAPRSEKFKIGCAGIFKYAKGLPYLFKAVAEVRRHKDVILELVGHVRHSEKETYDIMAQRTFLHDVIHFREPMSHDGVKNWFMTLDVFVLPSLTEGCPNILMEAMAAGLPVVATATGAVPDLIEHQLSGLIVPRADSVALAAAIKSVIEDVSRAQALGNAARQKMMDFSPAKELSGWSSIYSDLLDK